MNISQDDIRPIFLQIADGIEDDILNGILNEGDQAYSQNQIAKQFNVNPATAAKGLNLLVDEGILYKKRGIGMYVSADAKEKLRKKREKNLLSNLINQLMQEARKLNIHKEEIIRLIDNFEEEE